MARPINRFPPLITPTKSDGTMVTVADIVLNTSGKLSRDPLDLNLYVYPIFMEFLGILKVFVTDDRGSRGNRKDGTNWPVNS